MLPPIRRLLPFLMLFPSVALGQGYDALGPTVAPSDGDPRAPLTLWNPLPARNLAFGISGQYVGRPIVEYAEFDDGSVKESAVLLDQVVAGTLGAAFGRGPVGVAVSAPLILSSASGPVDDEGLPQLTGAGPTLGDIRIAGQLGFDLRDDEFQDGLMVGLAPVLRLPTGDAERYLGDTGIGVEVRLSAAYQLGALRATVNAGVETRNGSDADAAVEGGLGPVFGAGASYAFDDTFAIGAEVTGGGGLQAASALQTPVEIFGSARYRTPGGLFVQAGAGRGTGAMLGSSSARAFLGFGWSGAAPADKPDIDEPPAPVPDGFYAFIVKGPEGVAVSGARVSLEGESLGLTGPNGRLLVEEKAIRGWRKGGLDIEARGFVTLANLAPDDDDDPVYRADLSWQPTPVRLRVRDEGGAELVAQVAVQGLRGSPFAVEDGAASFDLIPGQYTAVISAEGFGTQTRDFDIQPGDVELQQVDAILYADAGPATLAMALTGPDGEPVEGAVIRIDGSPYGVSASGGALRIESLSEGEHRVEVIHDEFQAVGDNLLLSAGDNTFEPMLRRLPGSVQVVARIPEGPVADATVTFLGPSRLAPAQLGSAGERIFVLRPGTWTALVASPTYGIQSREIIVPDDRTELTIVDVVLISENGAANVDLRVVDPDGAPAEGVEIELDGVSLGTTSSGGNVELSNLNVGARRLTLSGDKRRSVEDIELFLVDGPQEKLVTIDWAPGTVRLLARTKGESAVSDAVARFAGPIKVDQVPLSDRGLGWTQLEDGQWQVLLSSPTYGLLARNLAIPPDTRRVIAVDLVLDAVDRGEADLTVKVTDPDGKPVDGAAVKVDGVALGSTVAGLFDVEDIGDGQRELVVEGLPFLPATKAIDLANGANSHDIAMEWAPGALKVLVKNSSGNPVKDAVVRMAGPVTMPPARVDDDGKRLMQLTEGSWQLLVTSDTYGFAAEPLVINEVRSSLKTVEVTMADIPEGQSAMLVRVIDMGGQPVEDAKVLVGGLERGRTAAGGALLVDALKPEKTLLAVEAKNYLTNELGLIEVQPGSSERLVFLDWVPTEVAVLVKDKAGKPVKGASVKADGRYELEPVLTDDSGKATILLKPGDWRVLASSDELGAKSARLDLMTGDKDKSVELQLDAAKVVVTGEQVVITDKIPFEITKATLKPEAKDLLDEIADTLLANPQITKVEVQGHTDSTGSLQRNLQLSEARAQAVMAALTERGVAPERLVARGYGATRPIASNEQFDGRKKNRRVDFEILEQAVEEVEKIVRDLGEADGDSTPEGDTPEAPGTPE